MATARWLFPAFSLKIRWESLRSRLGLQNDTLKHFSGTLHGTLISLRLEVDGSPREERSARLPAPAARALRSSVLSGPRRARPPPPAPPRTRQPRCPGWGGPAPESTEAPSFKSGFPVCFQHICRYSTTRLCAAALSLSFLSSSRVLIPAVPFVSLGLKVLVNRVCPAISFLLTSCIIGA